MIFILTKKCVIENNSFVGYSNSSQRQLTEERRIYLKNYVSIDSIFVYRRIGG